MLQANGGKAGGGMRRVSMEYGGMPAGGGAPGAGPRSRLSALTGLRHAWGRFGARAESVLLRGAWLTVAAVTLVFFVALLPAQYARLATVCTAQPCGSPNLTPAAVRELQSLGLSADFYAGYAVTLNAAFTSVWFVVGAIVFWWRPRATRRADIMALFTSLALITFGSIAFAGSRAGTAYDWPTWRWLSLSMTYLGNVALLTFFYVFPDGRFVPRWTGILVAAGTLLQAFVTFLPSSVLSRGLTAVGPMTSAAFLLVALGTQIYRYRRALAPTARQQTKWVVYGICTAIAGSVIAGLLFPLSAMPSILWVLVRNTVYYLLLLAVPLSIGMAILRYRLWDVDLLINRTLVYAGLTAGVVVLYVVTVGALSTLFAIEGGNLWVSLVATGLVAVLFAPLRSRLQRAANRLVYGERDDPYAVIARLGQRLEAALAPEAVLPALVETVAQALKAPYAEIDIAGDGDYSCAASYGAPPSAARAGDAAEPGPGFLTLPLAYQAEAIGRLVLAPRGPDEKFSPADLRLLQGLAYQAGAAVHAVRLHEDLQRLTADLQKSRARLVVTREEERRRIRRDLHDGLGPTLAALALAAGTVADLAPADPPGAVRLAHSLQDEIRSAIADIRRLVYELRPPTLDQLGLVGAVRSQAMRLTQGGAEAPATCRLQVTIDAPAELPPLPAAVEVAAYRIAQEALLNVARHAEACTCRVRIWLDDGLEVEITDDGRGLAAEYEAGVGLNSMRERAAELGGVCTVESAAGGGTRVHACMPLMKLDES